MLKDCYRRPHVQQRLAELRAESLKRMELDADRLNSMNIWLLLALPLLMNYIISFIRLAVIVMVDETIVFIIRYWRTGKAI